MRGDAYQYRVGFGGGLTPAVKYLILANIGVFMAQAIPGDLVSMRWFGLVPEMVTSKGTIYQFVTYMFLHDPGNIFHILINMLILWIFGSEVERHWGTQRFVGYYFLTGIGAGLFHFAFYPQSAIPVVGASGAVYGILAAFGVLFPDRVITLLLFLFLPVRMKAKYLVLIFGGIALFHGVTGTEEGVAHLAHLGGMVIGFVLIKTGFDFETVVLYFQQRKARRHRRIEVRRQARSREVREQVDTILDKINEVGFENLTAEEQRILREASKIMTQEKEHH